MFWPSHCCVLVFTLDPLPTEADLVVVGMVGELIEVDIVRLLHQHALKVLTKKDQQCSERDQWNKTLFYLKNKRCLDQKSMA